MRGQVAVFVSRVVEHLHFRRGLPDSVRDAFASEEEDAAVGAGLDRPLQAQFEIGELRVRHDIAATFCRCALRQLRQRQCAVFDTPGAGNCLVVEPAPAAHRLAVD